MSRQPKKGWIRLKEAGHRLGVHPSKISKWGRYGYVEIYRVGKVPYVDWQEMLMSRFTRRIHEQFRAKLRAERAQEIERPKPNDPRSVEPAYAREKGK